MALVFRFAGDWIIACALPANAGVFLSACVIVITRLAVFGGVGPSALATSTNVSEGANVVIVTLGAILLSGRLSAFSRVFVTDARVVALAGGFTGFGCASAAATIAGVVFCTFISVITGFPVQSRFVEIALKCTEVTGEFDALIDLTGAVFYLLAAICFKYSGRAATPLAFVALSADTSVVARRVILNGFGDARPLFACPDQAASIGLFSAVNELMECAFSIGTAARFRRTGVITQANRTLEHHTAVFGVALTIVAGGIGSTGVAVITRHSFLFWGRLTACSCLFVTGTRVVAWAAGFTGFGRAGALARITLVASGTLVVVVTFLTV